MPGRHGLAAGALTVSGFAASLLTPAHAVVLGDVAVDSALGQPLSARIPVQLGPGEMLGASCVSVPSAARSDLSALPRPVITMPEAPGAGSFDLRITTSQPLYEPMYELQVQVRCPGTALMVRQYVLMLDLPGMAPAATVAAAAQAPAAEPVPAPVPAAAPPPAASPAEARSSRPVRPRPHVTLGAPISSGTRYRVAAGDTLSTIAARVGAREDHGIWKLADEIFAANPGAFINGNPDLIKLGSEIVIPTPIGGPVSTDAPAAPAASAAAQAPAAAVVPAAPVANPAPTDVPAVAAVPGQPAAAEPEVSAAEAVSTAPPVFQDEQPVAAAPVEAPVEAVAPPRPAVATRDGAPPWLAALIGVLIGAGVSLVLLRDRLVAALGGLLALRKPAIEPMISAPAPAPAPRPPQFTKPLVAREPSMVVEEHHEADDDTDRLPRADEPVQRAEPVRAARAATPVAAQDEQDLASLFGQEPDLPLFEDAAASLPSAEELDLDLSAAAADASVDEDIGWIGDETALTPTVQAPAPAGSGGSADTVEHIDLQTLSQRAGDDAAISQTLKDALNLLESDYEDELTASQVVDRKQLERMLDDADAEDTLVRTGTDQMPRRR